MKKIERELYKGENIDYKARSAQTFHIEGFKKMYNNGVASQAQNFGNDKDASRSKINDVLRINLPIDGEFRFQNNTRLFGNEGRLSRNKDIIRPPSAIFQDEFLGRPVINPHHHRLLLNNDRLCDKGRKVSLFISVLSSVRHFEQRDAVRRTWGSGLSLAPLRARIAFFLASPPQQEAHVQSQITIEAQTYGDIIQEDFLDTYHNLTLKSIMALKWAEANCPQAEYFMKTDDDIFVNVPKLLTFLQEQSQLRDYFIAGEERFSANA
ncbi:Glycosyl transferase family 31 [Trinorchestia longiramus]|nr:Glycosyl transferase family 31 [Trinorchestia longiramus]